MEEGKLYKILVSDPVSEEGLKLLREVASVDVRTDLSPQDIMEIIGEYDGLLVRSGTHVTA